MLVSKKVYAL